MLAGHVWNAVSTLKIPHETSPISDHLTISVVAASFVPSKDVLESVLVETADSRLYEVKHKGRNQVAYKEIK